MSIVKLYIGGLPPSADDTTLAELLSAYGQVESVTLARDSTSSMHCLGYGFAKMESERDANRAIAALHNSLKLEPELYPNVGPLQLRIVKDQPADTMSSSVGASSSSMKLFIGGVPGSATGRVLRTLFQPYGEIADLFIAPEKGYAFVKFSNQSDALAAMANINGVMLPNGVRPLEVRIAQSTKGLDVDEQEAQLVAAARVPTPSRPTDDWSEYFTPEGKAYYHNKVTGATQWDEPQGWNGGSGSAGIIGLDEYNQHTSKNTRDASLPIGLDKGPPGANIFVYGLPDKWKEREFNEEFSKFGDIFSIKIIYDKATGASKGYGFISYSDPRAAADAVEAMHGTMLGGRKLKVQIKRGEEQSGEGHRPY